MFREYPKIEGLYARNSQNPKEVLVGTYRSREVELLKDLPWEWTSKIDGTNTQIHWDGHTVEFGGRTSRAVLPEGVLKFLEDKFAGEENEEILEQKFGENDVVLYGEGYGAKIQKGGGLYRADQSFILFDVRVGNTWLKREAVEDIAAYFGLDVVPVAFIGTIDEAVEYMRKHPGSLIAAEHEEEGLVGRAPEGLLTRMGNRIMVKVKWNEVKDYEY